MRIAVVTAPEPVVIPSEIPGGHVSDDVMVAAMIAAATANIDGPPGWLGRAIGGQVFDAFADRFGGELRLPCGPVIDVQAVAYRGAAGAEQTLSPAAYRLQGDVLALATGATWPATICEREAVRVRYRAGFAKPDGAGLVNETPAPIKAAIILMTVGLLTAQARDGGLRSFEVPGVATRQFNSPELMDRVRTVAVERLLSPFRVYA